MRALIIEFPGKSRTRIRTRLERVPLERANAAFERSRVGPIVGAVVLVP